MKARLMLRLVGTIAVGMMLATMAHAEFKWSGYTQLRYNQYDSDLGKNNDSAFQIRRARIKIEGPVADDTTITLQADLSKLVDDDKGSGNVELKDALISRKLSDELTLTGGYSVTPFGYEVPTSDAVALAFERSRAASVLFPGERDTGLYLHYRPTEQGKPQVDLGYGNGLHSWYDGTDRDTSSSNFNARVQWPLPNKGIAGASYMKAHRTRTVGGTSYDFSNQDVWGLHARYNFPANWVGIAEYYSGHQPSVSSATAVNQSVSGWYALAAYTLTDKPVTPFYRYDTFDFGGSDDYTRHTIGVAWDRTKSDRYSFQIENGDDGKGAASSKFTNFAVQWQVKY